MMAPHWTERTGPAAPMTAAGAAATVVVVMAMVFPDSAQADEGQDEHHDHDQPYDIDDAVHLLFSCRSY